MIVPGANPMSMSCNPLSKRWLMVSLALIVAVAVVFSVDVYDWLVYGTVDWESVGLGVVVVICLLRWLWAKHQRGNSN